MGNLPLTTAAAAAASATGNGSGNTNGNGNGLDSGSSGGVHSWGNTVLALSKWIDKGVKGHLKTHLRTDSQDAWIFQSPLLLPDAEPDSDGNFEKNEKNEKMLDFVLGAARCDNRIAYILANNYNYHVINAAFAIHAIEYDNSNRIDTVYGTGGAIIGTGLNLFLRDDIYTPF